MEGEMSTLALNESWVELDPSESVLRNTIRIVEKVASDGERTYLEDLRKELSKPEAITDTHKEKKIADTLAKLVTVPDVHDLANECMSMFVRDKLRTYGLIGEITDQLYDSFAEEQELPLKALKNLITAINIDACASRDIELAYRLVDALVPRLIGGITAANIAASIELLSLLRRRFHDVIRTHKHFKDIRLWENYICTHVTLGKGSFATVYLGHHKTTAKIVAIKTLDWDRLTRGKPEQEKALRNEIEIMRAADHPNIVRLYDVLREGCMVNLVLEYCGGGSLEEYIKKKGPLPEEEVRHFIRQLALGLKHLRDKGVIHRDLKPDNLLLTSEHGTANLKIADFTFARHIEPGDFATSFVGSPLYMAPEIFFERKYSEKADLWSVGAVVYKMLTTQAPYPGNSFHELLHNIKVNAPKMPSHISADMKDLLESLLQRNPDLRISWTEFFLHKCLNLETLNPPTPSSKLTQSEQLITMERELTETRKEIQGLKASNERMQKEIVAYEKKLREAEQREKRLDEDNRVLISELAKQKENGDKRKDGKNWVELFAREQQISAEREAEAEKWKSKAEAAEGEVEHLRKLISEYQAREQMMKDREAEAKAEQQMVYAEIKELRTSVETIVVSKEQHRVMAAQAQEQLKQLMLENAELKGKLNASEQQAEQTEAQHAATLMHITEFQSEKETLEKQLQDKDEQIRKLQQELAEAKADFSALQSAWQAEALEHGVNLNRRG